MEYERTIHDDRSAEHESVGLGEEPVMVRVGYFFVILIPVITVTLYIMLKSRRYPIFCDARSGASVVQRKAYDDAGVWKVKQGEDF
jgi:hypothetical protein